MNSKYDTWNSVKKKIEQRNHKPPHFKEADIWWVSVGYNIGHEVYGKGKDFCRPVLIIKKFNRYLFIGIPLSTKVKDNKYYVKISFQKKTVSALISQIRTFSSFRVTYKIGELDRGDLKNVLQEVSGLLKLPPSNKGGSRG